MRKVRLGVKFRTLLVDDHKIVREGIRALLDDADSAFEVVGEVGSATEARAAFTRLRPNVVILDVVLPDGDGIQLCREITAEHPETRCIVLTSFPHEQGLVAAALAGASAYLAKDIGGSSLIDAVHSVTSGDGLLGQAEVRAALDQMAQHSEGGVLGDLTPQEHRVFDLLGQGLSNREIAEQLNLTEKTVKNYVSRLLGKLHMDRRTAAAALSARLAERRAQEHARGSDGRGR